MTSLFTGRRAEKDDAVFEALGTADELSSNLGVAQHHCIAAKNGLEPQLEQIQCLLQEVMSHIATPRSEASPAQLERTEFSPAHVELLEEWIDEMDTALPPLRNFILPSGGLAACSLHVARSVR